MQSFTLALEIRDENHRGGETFLSDLLKYILVTLLLYPGITYRYQRDGISLDILLISANVEILYIRQLELQFSFLYFDLLIIIKINRVKG